MRCLGCLVAAVLGGIASWLALVFLVLVVSQWLGMIRWVGL